ncbi:MAG TPA: hypothetical protein VFQ84_11220 [Arenimonas sp.]|uniref:hypothetical protein n=1 Tax=Arenimonas sp. TaxID=1872635 RepID=UPI002D7FF4D4|nr:hypothetical protein [Arenimonas sp.]HEU0153899.1 hypothetical protein [Arenimonas sp.]
MPRLLGSPLLVCLGLALATLAIYWPGLTGAFLFDDYPNIVSNPIIQIQSLDWASIRQAARGYVPGEIGRPLATIGFALDFLAWGKNPWGYKLHSVIVHSVNALLVFALVRRLLQVPAAGWQGRNTTLAAAAIALLWAAHPLQVSTVLYVVQRMEMLCHTFVLLGLLAYLHGRLRQQAGQAGAGWLVFSALLAMAGLLAKESAALFPVYTLALELTLLRFAGQGPAFAKRMAWAYGLATGLGALVFFLVVLPPQLAPEAYAYRPFTLDERLLTQLRVLPMYLGQILFPLPRYMVFYYDQIEPSRSLLEPMTTLLGGGLIVGLLALAAVLRQRAPLVSLGILWFFGAHFITSNVLPLEMAFEHRNYFALLGILLALADLLRRVPVQDTQTGKALMAGIVTVFVVFLCVIRAATWGAEFHLHTDLVAHNPGSPRASNDLAIFYMGMSDSNPNSPFYAWGMREFERGSLLPNASPLPEQGLILSAAAAGQPIRDEWWDRMIQKLQTRPIGVQEGLAVVGLLRQRSEGVEMDDRRLAQAYTTLADRSGQLASTYAAMGDHAINTLGDESLARDLFLKAIDACRDNPTYARQIIETLALEGHTAIANAALGRAAELGIPVEDPSPARE